MKGKTGWTISAKNMDTVSLGLADSLTCPDHNTIINPPKTTPSCERKSVNWQNGSPQKDKTRYIGAFATKAFRGITSASDAFTSNYYSVSAYASESGWHPG